MKYLHFCIRYFLSVISYMKYCFLLSNVNRDDSLEKFSSSPYIMGSEGSAGMRFTKYQILKYLIYSQYWCSPEFPALIWPACWSLCMLVGLVSVIISVVQNTDQLHSISGCVIWVRVSCNNSWLHAELSWQITGLPCQLNTTRDAPSSSAPHLSWVL